MQCRCGGRLRLDMQHVVDAERFKLLDRIRLLWRCCLCGRAEWSDARA